MREYRVVWEIDVDAASPRGAAEKAEQSQILQAHQAVGCRRGVFAVREWTLKDLPYSGASRHVKLTGPYYTIDLGKSREREESHDSDSASEDTGSASRKKG